MKRNADFDEAVRQLLARGYSAPQIAARLHASTSTIKRAKRAIVRPAFSNKPKEFKT